MTNSERQPSQSQSDSMRFAEDMQTLIESSDRPLTRSEQPIVDFEQTMSERIETRKHIDRGLGNTALSLNELEGEHDG